MKKDMVEKLQNMIVDSQEEMVEELVSKLIPHIRRQAKKEVFKDLDKEVAKPIEWIRATEDDFIDEEIYIGDIVILKGAFELLRKKHLRDKTNE